MIVLLRRPTVTVKQLDHMNLSVSDMAATTDFYGRVFGFVEVDGGVQDGVVWKILQSGEALLCLYEHPDYTFVAPGTGARPQHGVSHFALRITDRAAWLETMQREQVEVGYGGEVRWPHSSAWYVVDPTGYEIEVALWDDDTVRFPS
jgi:catechol 2,3-dioxygenase-like lactoylglutathione lyase family enzyme